VGDTAELVKGPDRTLAVHTCLVCLREYWQAHRHPPASKQAGATFKLGLYWTFVLFPHMYFLKKELDSLNKIAEKTSPKNYLLETNTIRYTVTYYFTNYLQKCAFSICMMLAWIRRCLTREYSRNYGRCVEKNDQNGPIKVQGKQLFT
jgi:hypothetical protein